MATTRYFRAELSQPGTHQLLIVFRASQTKVYQSASFGRYGLGWSSKPAAFGSAPASEITKAEYDALQAQKAERVKGFLHPERYNSPQDSWVFAPSASVEG